MGNITQVTATDPSFPFGYDQTQFDLCLDISVLKDNLNSICEKVDDNNFQKIILVKLNQVVFVYRNMKLPSYYWMLTVVWGMEYIIKNSIKWD